MAQWRGHEGADGADHVRTGRAGQANRAKSSPVVFGLSSHVFTYTGVCFFAEDVGVVEDSLVGLRAAKAAGMKCVITYTEQTAAEDFYGEGADAKLLDFSAAVCSV